MVGFQFDGDRIAPAGARVAVVIDGYDGNPRLQMTRDGLIQHGRAQRGERFADADTAEANCEIKSLKKISAPDSYLAADRRRIDAYDVVMMSF